MASYEFETVWRLRVPLAAAWDAIIQAERWPAWWRGVERVELLCSGDDQGIGWLRRMTWRSKLPYSLSSETEVIRVEPMNLIEGRASGELAGAGVWHLRDDEGVVTLRYL